MAVEASTPIGSGRAATTVTNAIRNAASQTGTSFNYLLATAKIESDLDPNLTMKSSSAAGLFQFIDQTWLGTLKQAGPAFGYGDYANAISRNSSGHYSVDDPEMRRQIMKLRNDPSANAVMAGVLTQQNAAALARRIGRPPTESELYIAHFFGAGGAGKLIQLAGSSPQANAAEAFPSAAHANRSIFYDRQGSARSMQGVYSELVRRFKVASDGPAAALASAAVMPMPAQQAAVAARPAGRASPSVTDVAGVTKVFAAAAARAAAPRPRSPRRSRARRRQERRSSIHCSAIRVGAPPSIPWWCRCGASRRASPRAPRPRRGRPSIPRSRAAATTAPPRRRSICSRTRARMRARCSAAAPDRRARDRGGQGSALPRSGASALALRALAIHQSIIRFMVNGLLRLAL